MVLNYKRIIKRLAVSFVLLSVVLLVYAFFIEPFNVKVRHVGINNWSGPKIVHISDLHYRGDRRYLDRVASLINEQKPDYICFTGDFISRKSFIDDAVDWLVSLDAPVIAVPGNHEFWTDVNLAEIDKKLEADGGDLLNNSVFHRKGIYITGLLEPDSKLPDDFAGVNDTRILLCHYPMVVDNLAKNGRNTTQNRYALILAGHSHGGQVRLPGFGPLVVPYGVGKYDYGLYETAPGPLYVTSGLGDIKHIRFNCPPELAVIE